MNDDPSPMSMDDFRAATGVSSGVISDLQVFRDTILTWNAWTNLVGPSFADDFWRRHALDSAQLFHVEQRALRWADIGSGAGFPGVVLAILMKDRSTGQIHLVESIGKRVAFLREVCSKLLLPVVIHHGRAESLRSVPSVDVVTARACAPLTKLLGYTRPFFIGGAYGLFLKGKSAAQEVADARAAWDFSSELLPSMSDPNGRLVRIQNVTAHS